MCHRLEHDQEAEMILFRTFQCCLIAYAARLRVPPRAHDPGSSSHCSARASSRSDIFARHSTLAASNEYRTERIWPAAVSSRRILTRHDSVGFLARAV